MPISISKDALLVNCSIDQVEIDRNLNKIDIPTLKGDRSISAGIPLIVEWVKISFNFDPRSGNLCRFTAENLTFFVSAM